MNYLEASKNYLDSNPFLQTNMCDIIVNKIKNSKLFCMFGAGSIGKYALEYLDKIGYKPDFICDNNDVLWGKKVIGDIICQNPEYIAENKENIFVLISSVYCVEIKKQLFDMGVKNIYVYSSVRETIDKFPNKLELVENIISSFALYKDELSLNTLYTYIRNVFDFEADGPGFQNVFIKDQYWLKDIIKCSDKEVFIDCGAYTGDTLLEFMELTNSKFTAIHSFEMDQVNFKKLQKTYESLSEEIKAKVYIYNCGVFDKTEVVYFKESSDFGGSYISENSSTSVKSETVALDELLADKKITFVKMDIEGTELKALMGLSQTIKNNKPKFAVCMYHKIEDLWEIPFFIKNLSNEYTFYLRQHTSAEKELVLYAVAK